MKFAQCAGAEINLDALSGTELVVTATIAVIVGDVEQVEMLLSYRTRKHFVSYVIDTLIQCAIDRKQHEIFFDVVKFQK